MMLFLIIGKRQTNCPNSIHTFVCTQHYTDLKKSSSIESNDDKDSKKVLNADENNVINNDLLLLQGKKSMKTYSINLTMVNELSFS